MDAYMSQPKHQLDTFRHWAGRSSDISYYLNSHHIDMCEWATAGRSRPIRVTASAATGVAQSCGIETEDTITLLTQWENTETSTLATAESVVVKKFRVMTVLAGVHCVMDCAKIRCPFAAALLLHGGRRQCRHADAGRERD